jgi:hypothetical protein
MRFHRTAALVGAGLLFVAASPPAAAQLQIVDTEQTKLYLNVATAGTLQALQHHDVFNAQGVKLGRLEPGFQNAFGDFGFLAKFGKEQEIEVYFDMYLSSRNHPSTTYGNEGYLVLHGIPGELQSLRFLDGLFDHIDVKAGHFLIDFGDQRFHRSNNAWAQQNPLVGNFVIDPNIVTIGMELRGKEDRPFRWVLGVSNGTTTEDFNDGRGFEYHVKLTAVPVEGLRLSGSYLAADHSDNPPRGVAGGSGIQFFSGNRSGERYGAILGGGQAPGGVLPQAGEKLTAWQLDATWKGTLPLELYGHYGWTEDADLNGSLPGKPKEEWTYYAADAVWRFTDRLYGAARYSAGVADAINGAPSDGRVDRYQIGGGYWFGSHMLIKLEYVQQEYKDFAANVVQNNGILAGRDPSFDGVVAEVSFQF